MGGGRGGGDTKKLMQMGMNVAERRKGGLSVAMRLRGITLRKIINHNLT